MAVDQTHVATLGGGGQVNKTIVGGMALVGALGIVKAFNNKTSIERPVLGTVVVLYVLSILDLFGGAFSQLASAIAMVAVVSALLSSSGLIAKLGLLGS